MTAPGPVDSGPGTGTVDLPILDEQPSPALETPLERPRPPWWRSGPVLMGVGGVLAVVLAFAGMTATGAVAVQRDDQSARADLANDNVRSLAAQVGVACDAGVVRPSPLGDPACRNARRVLSDPNLRLTDDTRALLETLRGVVSSRPPGAPRLDPAQVLAAAARDPGLRDAAAGDLARAARAAVAAEQGAVSDRDAADAAAGDPGPGRTARDVRFERDPRGRCRAVVVYSDGSTDRVDADSSSCGPPPAPDNPEPTGTASPTSSATTSADTTAPSSPDPSSPDPTSAETTTR